MAKQLFTVGHSTRDLADFIALLREHGIERLADIRRYPGSRRYPHFSREALSLSLPAAGIEYLHMPELGGRRKPLPDSRNTAWRNEQFRAYADHMATAEFRDAIDKLVASPKLTAYMCAEAVPWRCHRSLIADALLVRGVAAAEIVSATRAAPHALTPFARVAGGAITYPAEGTLL